MRQLSRGLFLLLACSCTKSTTGAPQDAQSNTTDGASPGDDASTSDASGADSGAGGQFRALTRDTRTQLESSDEAMGRYRFCALMASGGCTYVDATFTFSAADKMILHVLVRGQEHLTWTADRLETRTLPAPFPAD